MEKTRILAEEARTAVEGIVIAVEVVATSLVKDPMEAEAKNPMEVEAKGPTEVAVKNSTEVEVKNPTEVAAKGPMAVEDLL